MEKRSTADKLERRSFSSTLEIELRDDDDRKIRGHAALFDSLSENLGGFREQIAPGAFDDCLGDDIRGLFNHDANMVLGRTSAGTMRVAVDSMGLTYEIDVPDTSFARDLVVSLQRKDVSQSSFAFTVEDDDWTEDDEGRVIRTINKVRRLYDVSPVTYPAYADTSVALRGLDKFTSGKEELIARRKRQAESRQRAIAMTDLGV
ncbi:MAG: HK97 family phage prohead protease [Gammaproteobacteria bacterium]|nr:HK97 family phage prohead protease [Gammaproteobacteria bacterium]